MRSRAARRWPDRDPSLTVRDAQAVFVTETPFSDAYEVVGAWPYNYPAGQVDERTVMCVLTCDPKFDIPLLEVAFHSPAGCVGAMGSGRTRTDRLARLDGRGLTLTELARLRTPVGLDVRAHAPEETAIPMAAEVIQTRWGGTGLPLSAVGGAIHPDVRQLEVTP
ncbi:MAG: XdhC family protein [Acidimicrobiales bacterium]